MKPSFRFLLTLFLLSSIGRVLAQVAPIDTTGGRYYQPIFAGVTVTRNVVYGSATTASNTTQQLLMDIYQPAGDTVLHRPLVIFAHGGGFVLSNKAEGYSVALCTKLARLGYVTASIDYRLGLGSAASADTIKIVEAAIRGEQDMKAAVRFFRRDAATTRTYRVSSSYIFVGGASAGGVMAVHTGYLDKASEVPSYLNLTALGGLEGNSGNPGYSSVVAAVINLSGGTTETPAIIEAGNAPLCSAHGRADIAVPYWQGRAGGLATKYVYGSGRLNHRATVLGIRNTLRTFKGAGHIPFAINAAYADTTFWTIRDFLRPILRLPGSVLATRMASTAGSGMLASYPQPAWDYVQLVLPENWHNLGEAQLFDQMGRVVRRFVPPAREMQLTRGSLAAGSYWLRFAGQAPIHIVFD